jgi:hypothetical protein
MKVYGPSIRYKGIQSVTSNLNPFPNLHVYNLGVCIYKSKGGLVYTHTQTQALSHCRLQTSIYYIWPVHTQAQSIALIYSLDTLVLIHTSESIILCCMCTLVIGSPTCGLPGCVIQTLTMFVDCVYTIETLQ